MKQCDEASPYLLSTIVLYTPLFQVVLANLGSIPFLTRMSENSRNYGSY